VLGVRNGKATLLVILLVELSVNLKTVFFMKEQKPELLWLQYEDTIVAKLRKSDRDMVLLLGQWYRTHGR
jgi:hypothetical protein